MVLENFKKLGPYKNHNSKKIGSLKTIPKVKKVGPRQKTFFLTKCFCFFWGWGKMLLFKKKRYCIVVVVYNLPFY